MGVEDEPRARTHAVKGWKYYSGLTLDRYKRNSRRMQKQNSLRYYLPVPDDEEPHEPALWPLQATTKPYTSEVLLFRKLWTVKNWVREVNDTEDYFDAYFHDNRFSDACFIGTILLYHFILLLRPEDGKARREVAIQSFPRNVSGKKCYPEGDLLILPRRKLKRHQGKLASMCGALRYLPKVMRAVNLMPGPHITCSSQLGEAGPTHLREERPSWELLEKCKLPQSSQTRNILLTDPNLTSLSKFFKPLFTTKYIYLEYEKTRYAVETLQLAFVVFQQLADTALWSEEYAYALFLIQNMVIIAMHLDILLPVQILKRYYIFTMTSWYYGRVYFHLSSEQIPEISFKEKYYAIYRNYLSWCTRFYYVLEHEVQTTRSNRYKDVDRNKMFVFPESKEECLLSSASGYMCVKIPRQWTRSCEQHNIAILFFCNKQLLDWTDSLRSMKKTFSFKERKNQLYSVLKTLCYVERIHLNYTLRVFLCLLEAKCLYILSILDVSQLINWFPSGRSPNSTVDSYSFETILLFSDCIVAAENCEIDLGKRSKILIPLEQEGVEKAAVPIRLEEPEHDSGDMQSSSAPASPAILQDRLRTEISESGSGYSKSSFLPTEAVLVGSNHKNSLLLRHERFRAYLHSPQYARNLQSWSEAISDRLGSRSLEQIAASTAEKAGSPVRTAGSPVQPAGSPVQPSKSVNTIKSPVHSASVSSGRLDYSASSVRSKPFKGHSTRIICRISNIPVAVSNMLKANEYRLEGFELTDTTKGKYSVFGNELSNTTLANIVIHHVQLQEYETDRKVLWLMTSDFADVLAKWFQEKRNKKRFHSEILARIDNPLLNKTFAFMFMGCCLTFYLMYRLAGNRTFLKNARYFYVLMTSQIIKYNLWEPVLKSLAEQAEMRTLLLLNCHKDLRRLPDRCVAVIRSYIHMLPMLYEACIMKQTEGGPTNCPRLRVTDAVFPFNVDADLGPEGNSDTDKTWKILRRAKAYLRKELWFDLQDGIARVLESTGGSKEQCDEETLQYCEEITVDFTKTAPKYPVLERWSWKRPKEDPRPLCTGDDDCVSAPCTVEGYIDDEEENNVVTFNLEDEPDFLNELVTLNKRGSTNFSTLPKTLSRVRKTLKKVTKKLQNSLDGFPLTGEEQYVRISIPGISSAGQSRAVPNHRRKELQLSLFMEVLQRSIFYLSDDGLPDVLALCKALLCLDSLLNLDFRISDFLRGSIADLEHFLSF